MHSVRVVSERVVLGLAWPRVLLSVCPPWVPGSEHSPGALEQKAADSKGLYKEHSAKGLVRGPNLPHPALS